MTITKSEIKWMLNFVRDSRDNSAALKDLPGQRWAALHKLEYENMSTLAAKLEKILETNAKRVAIN